LTALAWVFPDGDCVRRAAAVLGAGGFGRIPRRAHRAGGVDVGEAGLADDHAGQRHRLRLHQAQIGGDRDEFDVQEIAYDRWNAKQLVNNLTRRRRPDDHDGPGVRVDVGADQGFATLILTGTPEKPIIRHGGNPLLRWTVDNFAVAMDPAGNVKPDKANAGDKIDPVVALIMALSRALAAREAAGRSAYEDNDLAIL
jgi:hypothetical protein